MQHDDGFHQACFGSAQEECHWLCYVTTDEMLEINLAPRDTLVDAVPPLVLEPTLVLEHRELKRREAEAHALWSSVNRDLVIFERENADALVDLGSEVSDGVWDEVEDDEPGLDESWLGDDEIPF